MDILLPVSKLYADIREVPKFRLSRYNINSHTNVLAVTKLFWSICFTMLGLKTRIQYYFRAVIFYYPGSHPDYLLVSVFYKRNETSARARKRA